MYDGIKAIKKGSLTKNDELCHNFMLDKSNVLDININW